MNSTTMLHVIMSLLSEKLHIYVEECPQMNSTTMLHVIVSLLSEKLHICGRQSGLIRMLKGFKLQQA